MPRTCALIFRGRAYMRLFVSRSDGIICLYAGSAPDRDGAKPTSGTFLKDAPEVRRKRSGYVSVCQSEIATNTAVRRIASALGKAFHSFTASRVCEAAASPQAAADSKVSGERHTAGVNCVLQRRIRRPADRPSPYDKHLLQK